MATHHNRRSPARPGGGLPPDRPRGGVGDWMIPFPDKKYQIIVVDPPWQIDKVKKRVRPNQVDMDYPMMSLEEIKALPIRDIADDTAILFLWTIDKYLFDSRAILDAWGFHYHLTMAWDKTNGLAMYGFNRQTEFIIVRLRGTHDAFPTRQTIPTSFTAKSPFHSAKPDIFYWMLDVLDGERIDIFARRERTGLFAKHKWDVWGNEV
jgi:N6-adenosine-specific RNA methylase IME4